MLPVKRSDSAQELREKIRNAVRKTSGPTQGPDPGPAPATPSTTALLLDTSSSMSLMVGPTANSPSRIDELRKVATGFPNTRQFHFGSHCRELTPGESIPNPAGGTNMYHAFNVLKNHGVQHVIVVSDGDPDDEIAALEAAQGLKVDCCYVGPDPAPEFLRTLAQRTGGKYNRSSLTMVRELSSTIRGLLTQ